MRQISQAHEATNEELENYCCIMETLLIVQKEMRWTNEDLKLGIGLYGWNIVTLKDEISAVRVAFEEEKKKKQSLEANIQANNVENERLKTKASPTNCQQT